MQELIFKKATVEDIDFVAWCNYTSTSPYPDFSYWDPLLEGLNISTIDFIKSLLELDMLSWCKVSDYYIGFYEGNPVCGASGFVMSIDDYRPIELSKKAQIQEKLNLNDESMSLIISRYEQVWYNPKDETLKPSGDLTIECLAVKPEFRKLGFGKSLLKFIIDDASKQGHKSVGISVTSGNENAEKLYLSVGFKNYVTYFGTYFDGYFPGTLKFKYTL